MPNWNALHYNAIAKEIRELFPLNVADSSDAGLFDSPSRIMQRKITLEQRAILTTLALNFAKRFAEDSELFFNPLKFLDRCSPNTDLYPLSELWEPKRFCKECDGPIHSTNYDVHDSCRRYPDQ